MVVSSLYLACFGVNTAKMRYSSYMERKRRDSGAAAVFRLVSGLAVGTVMIPRK